MSKLENSVAAAAFQLIDSRIEQNVADGWRLLAVLGPESMREQALWTYGIYARSELRKLSAQATSLVAELLDLSTKSQQLVEIAEHELEEGVITAFWDAIEEAVTLMGCSVRSLESLVGIANIFPSRGVLLKDRVPLPIDLRALPDISLTEKRMRRIIREAQKKGSFAMVYEQRKTNALLNKTNLLIAEGFKNVGASIGALSERLERSIDQLIDSVSQDISVLADKQQEAIDSLNNIAGSQCIVGSDILESVRSIESEVRLSNKEPDKIPCKACDGGACKLCRGEGSIFVDPTAILFSTRSCPRCKGSGRCLNCNGLGFFS